MNKDVIRITITPMIVVAVAVEKINILNGSISTRFILKLVLMSIKIDTNIKSRILLSVLITLAVSFIFFIGSLPRKV